MSRCVFVCTRKAERERKKNMSLELLIDLFTCFYFWNKLHMKCIMSNTVVQQYLTSFIMICLYCFSCVVMQIRSEKEKTQTKRRRQRKLKQRKLRNKNQLERKIKTKTLHQKTTRMSPLWSEIIRALQFMFSRVQMSLLATTYVMSLLTKS